MVVGRSLLSVKDLCFERDDTQVIDSVCLDLSDGELLQIEGPNGSGKTTLLRLLTSALTPTRGNIYYQGRTLSDCRFEYLSELLFLGHQSAVKVTLSAEENLSWMTGRSRTCEELLSALDSVELTGYSDVPCYRLSAGQQRRVALAQLLISNTKLWILDEPFAALDSQGVSLVEQCMQKHLDRGGSVVLSTHQPVSIKAVRRYSLMDQSIREQFNNDL